MDVSDVRSLVVKRREKLGIALDRIKRVTRRRYIYTRVEIERMYIEGTENSLSFCVDIEGSDEIVKALRGVRSLVRLGGEGFVAMASTNEATSLLPKAER